MGSAIYTVTSNATVAADGNIPVGTIVRRLGCQMGIEGDAVSCRGKGYYKVCASATVTPTTAGPVGIRLYSDGNQVPGAVSIGTASAASPVALYVCAVVRTCGSTMLSFSLDSQGATTGAIVENLAVTVEEVA